MRVTDVVLPEMDWRAMPITKRKKSRARTIVESKNDGDDELFCTSS